MRSIMFVILAVISTLASADSPVDRSVLVFQLGAQAHHGIVKTCAIHLSNPALKGKEVAIMEQIGRASNEEFKVVHTYNKANVPSIEYYAQLVQPPARPRKEVRVLRVNLLVDYGNLSARDGKDSRELIQLIDELCETGRKN